MRRSDSLNTFSCLSLYGLLTRFCTGALRVSQVLKRFSPYMPRPSTPAESPASCLYRCSLIGFQSIYTVALRFDNVTRLYSFRDGATPLTACMIPCVRLHCVVRFFFLASFPLLHSANTQYGWLAIPYPAGTSTLQETPSFPWRTDRRSTHVFNPVRTRDVTCCLHPATCCQ